MGSSEVVRLVRCLESAGPSIWLDGGWGIDALLRRQTRVHDDLDLVAVVAESAGLISALAGLGYELAAGAPSTNYVLLDRVGRQVDVHPVTFDEGGNGIYRMSNGMHWSFPARGFEGTGAVDGYAVRCLTADVQVLCHNAADYEFDEDDYRDLWALHEQFGVEVPPDVARWARDRGTRRP
jgi:lincosamide nucleotidyltransferase A/C/D/E